VQVRVQARDLLLQITAAAPGVEAHHAGGNQPETETVRERRQLAWIHGAS
jgi:hypothetical protein